MTALEAEEAHLAYDEWDRFRKAEKDWKENDDPDKDPAFDPALYRLERLAEIDEM